MKKEFTIKLIHRQLSSSLLSGGETLRGELATWYIRYQKMRSIRTDVPSSQYSPSTATACQQKQQKCAPEDELTTSKPHGFPLFVVYPQQEHWPLLSAVPIPLL
ncbi:MAG: hypothetical protein ACXVDN_10645 [Ktedonobacteraceae bacterium]